MDDFRKPFPDRAEWDLGSIPVTLREPTQAPMFNARVSTRLPSFENGKDISFHCFADDGSLYFCKEDSRGQSIRAIEWIATQLARHLGIPVADCAILEDDEGETFFGSKKPNRSLAGRFELQEHIQRSSQDETGRPMPWLGQFFAQLWAYDLFVCNPDRDFQNLILDQDGAVGAIKAIDFASAKLLPFPNGILPIESDPTVTVGKLVRSQFGSHKPAAIEMLGRIGAVPRGVVEGILRQMPSDWLSEDQAGGFVEVWSNGQCQERVEELKALIANDW